MCVVVVCRVKNADVGRWKVAHARVQPPLPPRIAGTAQYLYLLAYCWWLRQAGTGQTMWHRSGISPFFKDSFFSSSEAKS